MAGAAEDHDDVDEKVREVVKESNAKADPLADYQRIRQQAEADVKRIQQEHGVKPDAEMQALREKAEAQRAASDAALKVNLQDVNAVIKGWLDMPASKPPEPPKYQDLAPRPDVKRRNPMEAFQSAGMIFALAASGLSRRPLTAAFTAAAGAMEGFEAGDSQRVKDQITAWKESNQTIKDQNDIETSRFNAIVSANNLSYNEKVQRIGLLNMLTNNITAQRVLDTGGIEAAEKYNKERHAAAQAFYKETEASVNHVLTMQKHQQDAEDKRQENLIKHEENRLKREEQTRQFNQSQADKAEKAAQDRQLRLDLANAARDKKNEPKLLAAAEAEKNIDEALYFLEQGIRKEGPRVSGLAGLVNRGIASGKSLVGLDYNPEAHEFEQRISLLKTTLPRILAGTSRVAASERAEFDTIVGGLKWGIPQEVAVADLLKLKDMVRGMTGKVLEAEVPTASTVPTVPSPADAIAQARAAIAKGAPRDAVIKRLQDAGIDPSGL